MALNVAIVGGGISGLSAAVSLRRAGHNVQVYERSAHNNEVGAAIHVPPNAARALLAWGLDPVHAKFVTTKSSYRAHEKTLVRFHTGREVEEQIPIRCGAPWFLTHRVDLHEELKRLATEPESPQAPGRPAQVALRTKVVKYNTADTSITLDNGDVVQADVVIAADGIYSIAVEAILGEPRPLGAPQNACFRFLIPADAINADPKTKFYTEDDDGRMKFFVGDDKRIVSYPCRNNEIHNFVAIYNTEHETLDLSKKESRHSPEDKAKLLAKYSDVHPDLFAVISKATEVMQWPLLFRPPIPTWTKGCTALAGDAAHPMLPHQGQGGAQGIEDGVVLGLVLVGATKETAAERLRLYEKIRRNRASIIQIFSNAGQDQPELIRKDASAFMPEDKIPKRPEDFFDYNFRYDVIEDSVSQLKEQYPTFELPGNFFQNTPGKIRA
ncbi:salicylate hydroxylase [Sporothrix schenckii 1099-18]|uniref:FAD-binding domain-containing protein n=2 Tax=Sporothrix schenckii TaxID=29908 RepID=U7PXH1_SPOS1|nr:salicylate hydroxylase [Sporothrix schenckii 1099-18]ERT00359.1 hypothetical protein HMPREF1624_03730 [Sporothrix schenckii ATCC 58251]KJR85163.1 salicylate hydroxylase [Sporothrix schenckii 1099-18]